MFISKKPKPTEINKVMAVTCKRSKPPTTDDSTSISVKYNFPKHGKGNLLSNPLPPLWNYIS